MASVDDRVTELERSQDRMSGLIERLDDSLDEIKVTLKEAIEVKSKVENHSGQINALWDKHEKIKDKLDAHEKDYGILKSQHEVCMIKHRDESQWKSQRVGNLVDKFLPYVVLLIVMAMAGKVMFK